MFKISKTKTNIRKKKILSCKSGMILILIPFQNEQDNLVEMKFI